MTDATDIQAEIKKHEKLFGILMGISKWDGNLVAAWLRSGQHEMSDAGRGFALALLAGLVDNSDVTGRRLKIAGDSRRTHLKDAKAEYDRTMEIGAWVQAEIDGGETFRSAIAGAEDEFGVAESTAQRAVLYYRQRIKQPGKPGSWLPLPPVRKR